jgi:hypothetical protein
MKVETPEIELEVGVDVCPSEDVPVLELVVLDPAGELVLPAKCVNMAIEERATTMTKTTKGVCFLIRSVKTCLSPYLSQRSYSAGRRGLQVSHHIPSIVEAASEGLKPEKSELLHNLRIAQAVPLVANLPR